MKSLNIPERYESGIILIIKLDEVIFKKLLNAIKKLHPFIDIDSLALEISSKLKEIDKNDLKEILIVIRSIYALQTQENFTNSEIIKGLSDAVLNDDAFATLTNEELKLFEQKLTQLLAVDGSISISAKAIGLLKEYAHIFINSRIVTDIRPVFKSETQQGIAGGLIVHTLKIQYQDASGSKEFYVALDSDDMRNLQEQLSESLVKADIIQSMLNKADIMYLEPKDNSK